MTSLTHNLYISSAESLKREWGDKNYPIWLLVNPKHPSVRQNIWAPILSEIQDKVYREIQKRIDTNEIYIRNVVSDGAIVPNTLNWWGAEVAKEIEAFRELVSVYKPKMLISFGAFPFEFVRRVNKLKPEKGPKAWANTNLEEEFQRSIENFDINKINRLPLIRRVFVTGKLAKDYNYASQTDVENYFHYVGTKLADKIIEHKDSLDIWI